MPRFDVRRLGDGFVVEYQADVHRHLATRLVIPLDPDVTNYPAKLRLNPVFDVNGTQMVLKTEFAATVMERDLGRDPVASLAYYEYEITGALDFLTGGY